MALIDCPECGGMVSSAATSCPACGYPVPEPEAATTADAGGEVARTIPHVQSFCSIENRAISKRERQVGARCPFCPVQLPPKNRFLLVHVDESNNVISFEMAPKPPFWKQTPFIVTAAVVGVLLVFFIGSAVTSNLDSDSGSSPSSARFLGRVLDYEPENPASLAFELKVTNASANPGKWECTVRAQDESNTYSGWDIFYDDITLAAGEDVTRVGTITITNEGAAYVTKVWVDECEER